MTRHQYQGISAVVAQTSFRRETSGGVMKCRLLSPGELKQPRRRPHRRLQKNNRFNDQNNSSARASRFLVHFFDVYCTTTTWNLLIWRLWRTWTYYDEFPFIFSSLYKIVRNSTSGKVACIWHTERIQIDATKFERTQIHFFTVVFTAVVVVIALGPFPSEHDHEQVWTCLNRFVTEQGHLQPRFYLKARPLSTEL